MLPTQKGRPEPVSCQLCRLKKLRCNRVQPCSNCQARNVPCDFLNPPTRSQRGRTLDAHSTDEILKRVARLESIVLPGTSVNEEFSNSRATLPTPSSEVPGQYTDLRLLENIGVREDSLISFLSNDLSFAIRDDNSIMESLDDVQFLPASKVHSKENIITIPPYKTAVILFGYFEDNLSYMCPILNFSTAQSLTKSFYTRVNQRELVLPGQAALLLSVCALSAFFYQSFENDGLGVLGYDAANLSKCWSRSALDVLEHSRRNTSGTLEDIQALIIMSYVTYHLDGFSARYRHLSATAIAMARDLGLHRLDADEYYPTATGLSLHILADREVKRRIYWHLIASDWTHSTMTGPQEGTYSIHPNHIQVNLPTEYDASDNSTSVTVPQPTGITFLLARIRLAHLSREYTDTIPLETPKLLKIPYQHIISLDDKIKNFLEELPYFFRADNESRNKSRSLEAVYSKIPIMRYCILTAAHTRRCRLHQKFLIRKSSDPRYNYSRQACLESARIVIQLYKEPKSEADSPSMETARMAMAVHYTHLALVIQVMDLCFNKNEGDYQERGKELLSTLRMLEGARKISPLLNRSLDSVVEVLRKHQVVLSKENLASPTIHHTAYQSLEENASLSENTQPSFPQHSSDFGDSSLAIDSSINEFWGSANHFEMDFDSNTWDALFSNLESGPL